MDLIYTNKAREDIGVLQDYDMDLAFGADENNFECSVPASSHCCEAGSLLYMEGTEYGGIVDSIESNTDTKEVTYRGRTWHGILNSKVIQPDSGEAYLTVTGEANAVIASLLSRLALSDLFVASSEGSGLTISNYKMNRYITGYDGIAKMLGTVGGKLKVSFESGKVVLSAEAVRDYTQDEEFDADLVPFHAKRKYTGVNHLICLGSGQLEERMVIHLYADTEGNISDTQTQFGLDEVCSIYEYSNVESEEDLVKQGMEEFKGLTASDEISIDFDADSDSYDVGDIIGAVDGITGLTATAKIAKKIVTIKNGKITVSLSPDTAKVGSSMEIGGGGGGSVVSGGVESFNGREGAVVPQSGDYTAAMVGAAPGGYGLGGGSTACSDCNNATENGWYSCAGAVNVPGVYAYGWMLVSSRSGTGGMIRQDYYSSLTVPEHYQRYCVGGVWSEWECITPGLSLGVEYRTTERFMGKPVYITLVDTGSLPDNTTKNVAHGISDIEYVVGCYGTTSGGDSLPYVAGNSRIDITAGRANVSICANYGAPASMNAYIAIRYTKRV